MRRYRTVLALVLAAVALALAACGDDEETTTTTSPAASEAPSGGAAAPSVGGLPPEFVECMAEQGYEIESSADIHSAPPEVLKACFGH